MATEEGLTLTEGQKKDLVANPPKMIPLKPGQFFVHFRNLVVYEVLHLATDTELNEPCVVYRSTVDGKVYSRLKSLFEGCVGLGVRRFTRIPKKGKNVRQ